MQKVNQSIESAKMVLEKTQDSLGDQLSQFNTIDGYGGKSASTIFIYRMFIAKEKALYQTLNQMKWQNASFIGYFWAPLDMEQNTRSIVQKYTAAKVEAYDNHNIPEPTYFKINEFTDAFQLIVDTYGIPSYREANPTVVNIVSFPFLFGMMFGDLGHGSVLLAFGTILCLFNNKLKGTALEVALPLRYLVFLMGIMATYAGLIYNEWFAMPVEIWQSCYNLKDRVQDTSYPEGSYNGTGNYYYQKQDFDCVYPMGQDPVWMMANNGLTFSNSVKMKLSVIVGILHMTIGVVIKGTNLIYFKHYSHFFFEVVTGLVILLFLFGWMDLLIFVKWFKENNIDNPDYTQAKIDNERMPSIITIMIITAFKFGSPSPEE